MTAVETTIEQVPGVIPREISIHLPFGMLGFERYKNYSLVAEPDQAPFRWLQVEDDPGLAFVVVPPFDVVPGYEPELSDEDVAFLGLEDCSDAWLFNVVTLRSGGRASVNLKGPVVINRHTFLGKQVVLANAANYSLQHPLQIEE